MKTIEMKQVVACYMLSVDKFSISINGIYNYAYNLSKRINKNEVKYIVDCGDIRKLTECENSLFEEQEDMLYLKHSYGRAELNKIISTMPYEVLKAASKDDEKNYAYEECETCSL